jgi:DNA (cytosine-5)-methyltransferase 1
VTLTLIDFFCGAGGSSQGAAAVPGVTVRLAANHWARAIESHALNFPDTDHFQGDLHDCDLEGFPAGDLFWASPECKWWSQSRGVRRDFDKQPDLFGDTLPDEAADRSRSLMWDVPRYLAAMQLRGRPVLAGVVENVIEARAGAQWHEWVATIRNLGYKTKLIAFNSMHARPRVTPAAPQSRDRLYLAYWAQSLGRDPDWDKWLRPRAWCPVCDQEVAAVQVWKRPGNDMGRYRQQYLYRCPHLSCRGQVVEPAALPAAVAIDWSLLGTRIGDREVPLKPKTIARIEAGLQRYARPIALQTGGSDPYPGSRTRPVTEPLATQTAGPTQALACPPMTVPAGGTWRDEVTPVTGPIPARTARENDGLAVPPFLVPLRSGRDRTIPLGEPMATVAAGGNHLGAALPPFITVLRQNCGTTPITEPLSTVTTSGLNHALVTSADLAMIMRGQTPRGDAGQMSTSPREPIRTLTASGSQFLVTWEHLAHLLIPYSRTGVAQPAGQPAPTFTAVDRCGLATPAIDVNDVLFRMLEPHEIGAAMAFVPGYQVVGSKREKVRQFGNAVTPPVAEILIGALVEAITGEAQAGAWARQAPSAPQAQ